MSQYVLAQFPSHANLNWVQEVRALAAIDELKWKAFQERRERLQSKADLWRRIEASMMRATLVVIDPNPVTAVVRRNLEDQGAEEGVDFTRDDLIDGCASALVADTPVAYLPNELSRTLGLYTPSMFLSFDKFTPEGIRAQIGDGLRDAKIFAARAHAAFDVAVLHEHGLDTQDAFRSPAAGIVLRELLSVERGFDREHPRSMAVLNMAADTIADAMHSVMLMPGEISEKPLIQEYDSRDIDHIQAADIAAGWAHELLALGDQRALGRRFGTVIINGQRLVP